MVEHPDVDVEEVMANAEMLDMLAETHGLPAFDEDNDSVVIVN